MYPKAQESGRSSSGIEVLGDTLIARAVGVGDVVKASYIQA